MLILFSKRKKEKTNALRYNRFSVGALRFPLPDGRQVLESEHPYRGGLREWASGLSQTELRQWRVTEEGGFIHGAQVDRNE